MQKIISRLLLNSNIRIPTPQLWRLWLSWKFLKFLTRIDWQLTSRPKCSWKSDTNFWLSLLQNHLTDFMTSFRPAAQSLMHPARWNRTPRSQIANWRNQLKTEKLNEKHKVALRLYSLNPILLLHVHGHTGACSCVKAGSMVRTSECPRNLQIPLQIAILSPKKQNRHKNDSGVRRKEVWPHLCQMLSQQSHRKHHHVDIALFSQWQAVWKPFLLVGNVTAWPSIVALAYKMVTHFTNQSCLCRQKPRGSNSPRVQPRFVECLKGFKRGEPEISSNPSSSKFISLSHGYRPYHVHFMFISSYFIAFGLAEQLFAVCHGLGASQQLNPW